MFAKAMDAGVILMFLNPANQMPFSKNFKINFRGAAVSAFIGVSLGSVLAIVAKLLISLAVCVCRHEGQGLQGDSRHVQAAQIAQEH